MRGACWFACIKPLIGGGAAAEMAAVAVDLPGSTLGPIWLKRKCIFSAVLSF